MTDTIAAPAPETIAPAVTPTTVPKDPEAFAKWAFGDAPVGDPADAPTTDDAAPQVTPEVAPQETPQVEAAETPAPDVPKLPFVVVNGEGTEVSPADLAAMTVTLTANGREQKLPLADVVRRAQSEAGAQQTLRSVKQEAETLASDREALATQVEELREIALRLLDDDEYRFTLAQQKQDHMSPEKRAERAERELAAERQRQEQEQSHSAFQRRAEAFAQQAVAPAISEIVTSCDLVSQEELLGRFTLDTAPILVNGVIPPERYDEVAAYLTGPFREFADTLQRQRSASADATAAAQAAAELKAKREAQRLKNTTAAVARPVGSVPDTRDSAKPQIENVKDAQKYALAAFGI